MFPGLAAVCPYPAQPRQSLETPCNFNDLKFYVANKAVPAGASCCGWNTARRNNPCGLYAASRSYTHVRARTRYDTGVPREQRWLFSGRKPGKPMTTRQLNRLFHETADAAGIKKAVTLQENTQPLMVNQALVIQNERFMKGKQTQKNPRYINIPNSFL
jgi:hypothetical protein